ncbi:MAG: hypothetical protein QOJ75_1369 [Chloroflexota bacterium]|nr:hypothetical protein [Chloroflexota bacterium]
MLGDTGRDASEDEAAETSAIVRAEDDDVGPLRLRGRQDRVGGVPLPYQEGCPGAGFPSTMHDQLHADLGPGPLLVDAPQKATTWKSQPTGVDNAQHEELRAEIHGEVDGFSGCSLGSR